MIPYTFNVHESNYLYWIIHHCGFDAPDNVTFFWLTDDEKFNAENGKRAMFHWINENAIFIDYYMRPDDQIQYRPQDIDEYILRSLSDIVHELQHRDDYLKWGWIYIITGCLRTWIWEPRAIAKEKLAMQRLLELGLLQQERVD